MNPARVRFLPYGDRGCAAARMERVARGAEFGTLHRLPSAGEKVLLPGYRKPGFGEQAPAASGETELLQFTVLEVRHIPRPWDGTRAEEPTENLDAHIVLTAA